MKMGRRAPLASDPCKRPANESLEWDIADLLFRSPGRRSRKPLVRYKSFSYGRRLVKHTRYYWLLLAESHLIQRLFVAMFQRIWALPVPTG